MDKAPEGEPLKLNFTTVVQNFISKYRQRCQSSLIPGNAIFKSKRQARLGLLCQLCVKSARNKDIMEMINSANSL